MARAFKCDWCAQFKEGDGKLWAGFINNPKTCTTLHETGEVQSVVTSTRVSKEPTHYDEVCEDCQGDIQYAINQCRKGRPDVVSA
jgi:hypothetical protein